MQPTIVNIVNFLRGYEPRTPTDMFESVRHQIELSHRLKLPKTFLLQYDAMVQPAFIDLLKTAPENNEIGCWLEMNQALIEAAGLQWRGRYSWDWHVHVGFLMGYTQKEREAIVDAYMRKFKDIFGRTPESVGSWLLDAHTLAYLADRYQVKAGVICRDQVGTDGYTLWGGYYNQGYYPSRKNGYLPAQTPKEQLPFPVFRMFGPDPIDGYDRGLLQGRQRVVTIEPADPNSGGNPDFIQWFYKAYTHAPKLNFNQFITGQENSFGWPKMAKGYTDQMELLAEKAKKQELRIETLGSTGKWFRKNFPTTPATVLVALEDTPGREGNRKTAWYLCKLWRVNFIWENSRLRIRDLHLFDERFTETHLEEVCKTKDTAYEALPVLDGFRWSTPSSIAGIRLFDASGVEIEGGTPAIKESGSDELLIEWPTKNSGVVKLQCRPSGIKVNAENLQVNWRLSARWANSAITGLKSVQPKTLKFSKSGFDYSFRIESGTAEFVENGYDLIPENNQIFINFDK